MSRLSYKTLLIILFFLLIPIILLLRINQKPDIAKAGWWNDSWHYRKAVEISGSSTDLTDFQVSINIGTSELITAGKMQSDCDDIRITDHLGNLLPHWVEEGSCNTNSTNIWTKLGDIPSSGATVYAYYGNPNANNTEDGNKVFEFFDDFNDGSINTSKWTQGTLASTSGTSISESGGNLVGGNSNRYLQSISTFTGNYAAETRIYETSSATNGFTSLGFYASSSNSLGILIHNGTTYVRNDASWPNIGAYSSGQWTRDKVQVIGTSGYVWHQNESTGVGVTSPFTNSGINSEYLRMSTRYDNGTYDQNYSATWDWVFVRKAVTTSPSASLSSEEVSPGPIAYWTLNEGTGTTAYDSVSSNHGTLGSGTSAPAWATTNCISSNCLSFDGGDYVNTNTDLSWTISDSFSIGLWINPGSVSGIQGVIGKGQAGGYGTGNWEWRIGLTDTTLQYVYWDTGGSGEITLSSSVTQDQWDYFTITYDPTNKGQLYKNGQLVSTDTTVTDTLQNRSTPVLLGHSYWSGGANYYFTGYLDEVKIYNYARSADQILLDYNAGASAQSAPKGVAVALDNPGSTLPALTAYWKFDEGYGTTSQDWVNNYDVTFAGGTAAPTWTNNGKFGKALSFNGITNYAYSTMSTFLTAGQGDWVISAWIKLTGAIAGSDLVIGKLGFHSGLRYAASYAIKCSLTNTSNITYGVDSPTLTQNRWYHLVCQYNSSTNKISLYTDGLKIGETDFSGTIYSHPQTFYIGGNSVPQCPSVDIDEVRLYNTVLTADQVKLDYNQGKSAVMGQSSTNTGSTAPAGSSAQEYCVPGDLSACAPPVAEWKLDEKTGTSAYDTSSNGNTGTFGTGSSAPTWTRGKFGSALSFDGNDYVYKTDTTSSSLDITSAITINAWIKLSSLTDYATFVGKRDVSTTEANYAFRMGTSANNDEIEFYFANSSTWHVYRTTASNLVADNWYYLSVTYDGSAVTIYKNGVGQSGSCTNSTCNVSLQADNNDLAIGRGGEYPEYHQGLIDHVTIYNYARTPAQIAWDYNRGKPIAHFKFDECQGTTINDWSGNANHGTLSVGPSGVQTTVGTCTIGSTASAWSAGATGKLNSSLNFDGNDDYVTTDTLQNTPTGSNPWTATLWFKPTTAVKQYLYENIALSWGSHSGTRLSSHILIRENILSWESYGVSCSNITDNFLDQWNHLGISYNGSTINFYINGILSPTTCSAGTLLIPQSGLRISSGITTSSRTYSGQIDDVQIFNYTLTSEQIKILYNNGAVSFN